MLWLAAAVLPSLLGTQPVPEGCVALAAPRVDMKANVARATSSPWVEANAWRFVRAPDKTFCIDAPGKLSALAAAEAFAYGVAAFINASAEGLEPFRAMLTFLRSLPQADLPAMVNIGVVDDGTVQAGELMNLLSRRNLLYRAGRSPDAQLRVNVTRIDAGDPNAQAYQIRQQVGDDNRLLRLYGSEVVAGRLTGGKSGNGVAGGQRVRLHLLNYSQRVVTGLRVRVLGNYPRADVHIYGVPEARLMDFSSNAEATEFTVVNLHEYAVIDLDK